MSETTWVYIESEPELFTVGFYDPNGKWHPDSDHGGHNLTIAREAAASRCNYLNGGKTGD